MVRVAAQETSDEDLIRLYLQDIGRHQLLDAEREIALAKAIEAGAKASARLANANGSLAASTVEKLRRSVEAGDAARRGFIEANLRLVVSNAR